MNQAQQYDMLNCCIDKLSRMRAALECSATVNYEQWSNHDTPPPLIFSDGSHEMILQTEET